MHDELSTHQINHIISTLAAATTTAATGTQLEMNQSLLIHTSISISILSILLLSVATKVLSCIVISGSSALFEFDGIV